MVVLCRFLILWAGWYPQKDFVPKDFRMDLISFKPQKLLRGKYSCTQCDMGYRDPVLNVDYKIKSIFP